MPIITLITDFGTADGYVGAMKGVILSVAPQATVLDVAHDLPAQDVEAGAWCLASCWRYFPKGTLHVVVVDPGVGSDRQAIIAEVDGQYLIGPDNGVFTHALQRATEREVRRIPADFHLPDSLSFTFHGRDIFAYAAGMIASGKRTWKEITEPAADFLLLAVSQPEYGDTSIQGRILHVDRYGNLITNIEGHKLPGEAQWTMRIGGADLSVRDIARTYSDVDQGRPVALIGSSGFLEIAICGGSAYRVFQTDPGTQISMKRLLRD